MSDQKSEAINRQIASLPGIETRWLSKKELKELPNILWQDEILERIIEGTFAGKAGRGLQCATDRRLIFLDKGMLGGLDVQIFPYENVSSIEYSTGLMTGSITIYASNAKDEIKNCPKDKIQNFAANVQQLMRASKTPVTQNAVPTINSQCECRPKILQLLTLRESNILDDAQFAEAIRNVVEDQ